MSRNIKEKPTYLDERIIEAAAAERLELLIERPRAAYWRRKRITDIILSALILLISAVPMLLVALAIVIDDPEGGPIYRQVRLGRHGEPFEMLKFRTMRVGAELERASLEELNEMDGPVFKIKNDPRITRVGKFLRKLSIDELPQMINVLRGDMSIVGPRPPLPEEAAVYTDYQRLRLIVTPGITCEWQIAEHRNDIHFDDWVEMDLHYIQSRSSLMDLKIMLKTPFVMLSAFGR